MLQGQISTGLAEFSRGGEIPFLGTSVRTVGGEQTPSQPGFLNQGSPRQWKARQLLPQMMESLYNTILRVFLPILSVNFWFSLCGGSGGKSGHVSSGYVGLTRNLASFYRVFASTARRMNTFFIVLLLVTILWVLMSSLDICTTGRKWDVSTGNNTADKRSGRSRSNRNSTSIKVKCTFCQIQIDNDKPALRCDSCENWVCLNCTGLPKSLYAELSKSDEQATSDIAWLCKVCKSMKTDLRSIHSSLRELKESNDTRLGNVEARLLQLEKSVEDTVKSEVTVAKNEIADLVKKDLAETIDSIVEHRIKEIEDRKNRSMNIIMFKVNQSVSDNPQERKSHDSQIVHRLFKAIAPEGGDLKLRTCFRLSNRGNKDDKTIKPLKVILMSKEQRRAFLTNSKKNNNLDRGRSERDHYRKRSDT